jgi:hypothetical protein
MFAINHAATGLIIKKAYPDVPMAAILTSVQLVEILWVVLNFMRVEKTTTEDSVNSVSDIHLEHMPFSHSVVSTVLLAAVAWGVIALGFRSIHVGTAIALGICSHLGLDLVSHARDIAIAPFLAERKLGLGLYERPPIAFLFEAIYGSFCWWIYGGSPTLFSVILFFNLANASFFLNTISGPERYLAHRPAWITGLVAVQIVLTAVLVGLFS